MSKDEEQVPHITTMECEIAPAPAVKPRMKGVDDALVFTQETGPIEWTKEEERRVLRKVDIRLLPMLIFINLLASMDSQIFGISAIFGMIKDLGLYDIVSVNPVVLSTVKYSWASSMPPFGQLIAQYPLLILAQHLPLGKWVSGNLLYTGLFALLMIACHDFGGTMAVRFFYGWQAVITPICIIISQMWWKADEQPLRIGLFSAGAACGSIIGQAFDMGAVSIKGPYVASPWKYMYLILGSVSIGYGLSLFYLFPDSPMKARFLTLRERAISVQRVQKNNTGIQTRQFKIKQAIECLTDPQVYLIGLTYFTFAFGNAVIAGFGALLISNFPGVGTFRSLQLLMPASGISIVLMILSGLLSSYFPKHRLVIAMLFTLPSITGNALLWKTQRDNVPLLMGGLYISVFFYGSYIQILGLVASNVAGHSKKTTVQSAVSIIGCVGGIVSPFAFKGEEAAKGYPTGMITVLALMSCSEVSMGLLLLHYRRANAKKDALMLAGAAPASEEDMAFLDLTDIENVHFRYHY